MNPTKIGRTLFVWDSNEGDYVEYSRNAYAYDCESFGNMTYLENASLYGYRAGSSGNVTVETDTKRFLIAEQSAQSQIMAFDIDDGYEWEF